MANVLGRFGFVASVMFGVAIGGVPGAAADAAKGKTLDAAVSCAQSIGDAAEHVQKIMDARNGGYLPPRAWSSADCKLAELVAKKKKATRLVEVIAPVTAALDAMAVDMDAVMAMKRSSADLHELGQAVEKFDKSWASLMAAYKVLGDYHEIESIAREKQKLAALAKKEKKEKTKSDLFYRLTVRVATYDMRVAQTAKDHAAFAEKLPIIAAAAEELAVSEEAEVLADYTKAILQLHAAASAVPASWPEDKVKALDAAHVQLVKESNAL